MFNTKTLISVIVSVIAAFILGIVGLMMTFSNTGKGESAVSRIITTIVFFLFCGVGIGYFNPRRRLWMISALMAWGSTLFGLLLTFDALRKYGAHAFSAQQPPYLSVGLMIMLLPFGLAILGGYVGSRLRKPNTGKLT